MVLEIFCLLFSISLALIGSLTFWPVQSGLDFYKPLVLFIVGVIVSIAIMWIFYDLLGRIFISKKKTYDKQSKIANFWFKNGVHFIDNLAMLRIKTRGLGKIPHKEKFLLVCNHRSNFDPMILTHKLKKFNLAFITKPSNMKIPLGGRLMHRNCFLPIDRNDPIQSLEVMKNATQKVKNSICSIGVFPEGTRQQEKAIGSFHEGCFNIAISSHAPIVVATLKNTEKIHHNFPFKISRIHLKILTIFHYSDYANLTAKDLSDQIWLMMKEDLENE